MEKKYFEIYTPGSGEIVEKKSRFIGEAFSVKTEEEVNLIITRTKKKYYDANHHCFAYCLSDENAVRASDDGEPSGTAGRPILDVILGENMLNTLVIVTRYFGGTLLGTGGLTRAYRDGAKAALNASEKLEKLTGILAEITIGYDLLGKAENLLKEAGLHTLDTEYGENVTIRFLGEESNVSSVLKKFKEISSGSIEPKVSDKKSFGLTDTGKVIWL